MLGHSVAWRDSQENHSVSLGLCVFALNLLYVYFAFKERKRKGIGFTKLNELRVFFIALKMRVLEIGVLLSTCLSVGPWVCQRNLPVICERAEHLPCLLLQGLSRNQMICRECRKALKSALQMSIVS